MSESQTGDDSVTVAIGVLRRVLPELPGDPEASVEDCRIGLNVTSLQMMQIVAETEKVLCVEFPDDALSLDTFESVASLAAVVAAVRSGV